MSDNSFTAYLVAWVDTRKNPDVVTHVGIYSERANSLTNGIAIGSFAFDVCHASAGSFGDAGRKILRHCNSTRVTRGVYGWAIDMLPQETLQTFQGHL